MLELLLERGADAETVPSHLTFALHHMMDHVRPPAAFAPRMLLIAPKLRTQIVMLLIAHGADANKVGIDPSFGMEMATGLEMCARRGRVDAVKFLLENGARADDRLNGPKALVACMYGPVRPNTKYIYVDPFAARADHMGVARLLLVHGCDPTRVVDKKIDPLRHAPDFIDTSRDSGSTVRCIARSRGDFQEFAELFDEHPRVQKKLARRRCGNCQGEAPLVVSPFQLCAGCESVSYCSRDCQKAHWRRTHRLTCKFFRKAKSVDRKFLGLAKAVDDFAISNPQIPGVELNFTNSQTGEVAIAHRDYMNPESTRDAITAFMASWATGAGYAGSFVRDPNGDV